MLNLRIIKREGEEVKTLIEGKTLRLASLSHFLALRGILSKDKEFDTAMEFLNKAWDLWKIQNSV